MRQIIAGWRRIYATVSWVIVGLVNGLSTVQRKPPVRHIWLSANWIPRYILRINFNRNINISIPENAMHYSDVIMSAMAPQIVGVSIVCPTVCSGADQRKHQSSASLAFLTGIPWWPVNSRHSRPVTRKMFPILITSWWEIAVCISVTGCIVYANWHWQFRPIL